MQIRKGSILLFLLLSCTLLLRADTVTFDDVANGTVIDTRYAGVTFVNPLGGDIYARNNFNSADTTNGVSLFSTAASPTGAFNAQYGAVDATFDTGKTFVSIDVAGFMNSGDLIGNSPLRPFVEVYSGNTLLTPTIYYGTALSSGFVGPYQTISFFSAAGDITRIRLSAQYAVGQQQVFAEFDNLVFDSRASATDAATGVINPLRDNGTGGGGGGGTAVPEPASLSLLGFGLVGVLKATRRKK